MTNREIITLMHKLSCRHLGPSGDWVSVFDDNDNLDKTKFNRLLFSSIKSETVLIYCNENNLAESSLEDAYSIVSEYIKIGTVNLADPRFTSQVEVEPIGVGAKYRTNK